MLAAAVLATPALAAGASAQAQAPVQGAPARGAPVVAAPPAAEPKAPKKVAPKSLRHLQVIGHRGARDLGPENTLESIELAFRAGARAVEFDVNFTKDEKLVLIHDYHLERTTTCKGLVTQRSYKQVAKCRTVNGEPVATLAAALAKVAKHDGKAYVHIKRTENLQQARKLVQVLAASGLGKRATIIASREGILRRLEKVGARRLGYVFDDPSGWRTPYAVLIPFNLDISTGQVRRAQRRGQFVIAVESRPLRLAQVGRLDLNGFMANDLESSMRHFKSQ